MKPVRRLAGPTYSSCLRNAGYKPPANAAVEISEAVDAVPLQASSQSWPLGPSLNRPETLGRPDWQVRSRLPWPCRRAGIGETNYKTHALRVCVCTYVYIRTCIHTIVRTCVFNRSEVYMKVCMCKGTYMHTYILAYMHTYLLMRRIFMNTCVHYIISAYPQIPSYIRTYMYSYICTYTHTHIYIYIYVCTYTYIYIYACVYIYIYVCIFTYIVNTCVYTYACMHA